MAKAYGTDPYTVLCWEPERLQVNALCYGTAWKAAAHRMQQITNHDGMVFPVVVVHEGGL